MTGVLVLTEELQECEGIPKPKSLGRLIAAFKAASTRRINEARDTEGSTVWQRNYYEHIIRSDVALSRIREYVIANPGNWTTDRENPLVSGANTRGQL